MNGAGAAAISICKLLLKAGFKDVTLCDRKGAIYEGRTEGMNPVKEEMSKLTNLQKKQGSLAEMLVGADVFIGVSAPGAVTTEMKTESFQEAMEEAGQPATLSAFLEEIALVADIDSVDPDQDYVLLMTLHSAKGLEFPNVFIVGMEDGVFPGYASIWSGDPSDIEEERRLCYVGITRAMKELTLTCAKQRMIRGETQYNRVSRFVREVPRELVDLGHTIQEKKPKVDDIVSPKSAYAQMKMNFQAKSTLQKKDFTVKKADSLDYGEGDTVRHVKFGVGIVKNIADGGRDYEVTVDFDKVGVKKMFAGFAKLKKI